MGVRAVFSGAPSTTDMKTKKSAAGRRAAQLPMRGGVVGLLVKMLRLSDDLRKVADDFSAPTVKRALTDDPKVAERTRAAIIDAVVQAIFPPAYLNARGLSADDVREHHDGISAALGDLLERWDRIASLSNGVDALPPSILEFLVVTVGLARELPVRAAAYVTLYDRYHGAFALISSWLSGEGLAVWYREVAKRGGGTIKFERLARVAGVERNTVKRIKNGEHIPQSGTIECLAEALEAHGIIDPVRKTRQTAAEIAFEIRLACAVAHVQPALRDGQGTVIEQVLLEFSFLRDRLRAVERAQVRDILARGTGSSHFAPLAEDLRRLLAGQIASFTLPMIARMKYERALLEIKPSAAFHAFAEDLERMAQDLRQATAELPGEQAAPMVAFLEHLAKLWSAAAEGREPPEPTFDQEALHASILVMQALAPATWKNAAKTDKEKERVLREAVRICPSMVEARQHLALLLSDSGRHCEALSHLREAVQLSPNRPDARELLAGALYYAGHYDEVLRVLADSDAALQSGNARTVHALALLKVGRGDEAEVELRSVLEEHPRHPAAHAGLAECRRAAGDVSAAKVNEAAAIFYATGKARS